MSDLALELNGVGKDYRFFSLQDVHLELARGRILGFIGPNGAGKSTTIRILMGLVHQDRGDVRVLGHPMPASQVAAKWDVGFASEDGLDGHLRGYATGDGAIVWDVDTALEYETVDGVRANGGSLDGPGPVVVGGMLFVNSGYAFVGGQPGNVLLAFSVGGR